MPHQTWTDYCASRTTNKAGNKDTRVFTQAWAQVAPSATKLTMITNDASIAILALDANNKVMILHSFKNLGGTLLNPTNKYACLIGTGQVTSAIIVDKMTRLATCYVTTPTYVSIIACINKAEIKALAHPPPITAAPSNFQCSASFLPAPWLLKAVLNANSSNPAMLILAASDTAAEFDKFKMDDKYKTEGEEQLKNFAKWAWAAQAGRITRMTYTVEPGNNDLLDYHLQCHNFNIIPNFLQPPPPVGVAPPPAVAPIVMADPTIAVLSGVFNLLEVSIARQATMMEAMNTAADNTLTFQKEKETKKKDCFAKFHPSSKQLFLFASTPDAEDVPDEIKNSCERFMNATTHGVTKQELNMQFKGLGLSEMAYATGLTLNLCSGKFLYAVQNNPSNFSCFSVHKGTPIWTRKNNRTTN
jgi:hypothetical protein